MNKPEQWEKEFSDRFTPDWWMGFCSTDEINEQGIEGLKDFFRQVLASQKQEWIERVEIKMQEYSRMAEEADSVFMKGIEKEGYTLAQAEHDAIMWGAMADALEAVIQELKHDNK